MVLPAEIRKQKISELANGEKQGQQKLFYRNENKVFPVFRVDLDWLIYNRHNGRLEAEMLTWEQEHSASAATYDEDLHKLIADLLWRSNGHLE